MANLSEEVVLEVEPRDTTGKNACRRLRAAGLVPANVYGLDAEPYMISLSPARLELTLRAGSGLNTIFTLSLAGETRRRQVIIKELQRDPVTELPVHVDFIRVDPNKPILVNVPVKLLGLAEGVKNENGVMDFVHREVPVECLIANIPEHLEVDVSPLHVNQHVSVSDLVIPEGVTVQEDGGQIIAVCVPPKKAEEDEIAAAEAAEAAEEEGAEEPEVAKKGKEAEGEQAPSEKGS